MFYKRLTFPAAINKTRTVGCPSFAKILIKHLIFPYTGNAKISIPQEVFLKISALQHKILPNTIPDERKGVNGGWGGGGGGGKRSSFCRTPVTKLQNLWPATSELIILRLQHHEDNRVGCYLY